MIARRVFIGFLLQGLVLQAGSVLAGSSQTKPRLVTREDDKDDGPDSARKAVAEGRATPLRELLAILRKHYPGEIVGVKLQARGDSLIYRVRILEPGGRLITVGIDAISHRIFAPGNT